MSLLKRPYKIFFVFRPGAAGAVFLGNTAQYHRVTPWVTGSIYLPPLRIIFSIKTFTKSIDIFFFYAILYMWPGIYDG